MLFRENNIKKTRLFIRLATAHLLNPIVFAQSVAVKFEAIPQQQ